ncbi:hypothetical protein VTI28DRAFT_5901 [Corynascus sepedonium]
MNKKLLILYAAANGNVDRYARLRCRDVFPRASRVHGVRFEMACLARGCYQQSAMAAWLAASPEFVASLRIGDRERVMLWRAIHARRVMDGVVEHLLDPSEVPDAELSYWIWHPTRAPAHALERLAAARPSMRPQCVRACIAAGYWSTYNCIMDMEPPMPPDRLMMDDACTVETPYYREDLLRRQERLGITRLDVCAGYQNWMDPREPIEKLEPQVFYEANRLRDTHWELHSNFGESEYDYGFYDGFDVSLEGINLYLSSPEEYKINMLRRDIISM